MDFKNPKFCYQVCEWFKLDFKGSFALRDYGKSRKYLRKCRVIKEIDKRL